MSSSSYSSIIFFTFSVSHLILHSSFSLDSRFLNSHSLHPSLSFFLFSSHPGFFSLTSDTQNEIHRKNNWNTASNNKCVHYKLQKEARLIEDNTRWEEREKREERPGLEWEWKRHWHSLSFSFLDLILLSSPTENRECVFSFSSCCEVYSRVRNVCTSGVTVKDRVDGHDNDTGRESPERILCHWYRNCSLPSSSCSLNSIINRTQMTMHCFFPSGHKEKKENGEKDSDMSLPSNLLFIPMSVWWWLWSIAFAVLLFFLDTVISCLLLY